MSHYSSSSLPSAVLFSPSEALYLHEGVAADCRQDGRSRLDYRYFLITTGVMPQAKGSATMILEDTQITVSVNLEVTPCSPEHPNEGIVQCSVEWSVYDSSYSI